MKLNDELDQIFDKHTRNLTQTIHIDSKGNEVKVISFDTVVLHAYEAKKDLLALFEIACNEIIGEDEEYPIGFPEWDRMYGANQLRAQLRKKLKEMV